MLFLQAFGEIPATAPINRTAIEIVMQDISVQEDSVFDFDNI
jgi:hypothetical protein